MSRSTTDLLASLSKPIVKALVAFTTSSALAADLAAETASSGVRRLGKRVDGNSMPDLEELARSIVLPLVAHVEMGRVANPGAVLREVATALEQGLTASLSLSADLDEDRIVQSIFSSREMAARDLNQAELMVFQSAVREAVSRYLKALPQLGPYQLARDSETLSRLTQVTTLTNEIASAARATEHVTSKIQGDLARISHTVAQIDPSRIQITEATDYAHQVRAHLDQMELFGVDLPSELRSYKLSVAYISLSVEDSGKEGESSPTRATTLFESFNSDGGRLLIRGEAGCGKSTLLKWVAIECCKRALDTTDVLSVYFQRALTDVCIDRATPAAWTWGAASGLRSNQWRHRVPFLIRLRDCKDGRIPQLAQFAVLTGGRFMTTPPQWTQRVLETGNALIMLDGIDEVPRHHRAGLHADVQDLVKRFPYCHFIVTTRPSAVDPGWLDQLGFCEAKVAPMSQADREACIDKWHEAIAQELTQLKRRHLSTDDCDRLKASLREQPAIARLATNPLLCAMICALHRDRRELPKNLGDLVEALCRMLLERREQETPHLGDTHLEPEYRELTYNQRKAVVGHVAQYMVQEGLSAIPRGRAETKVRESLKPLKGCKPGDAKAILRGLIERSGMLREKTQESVDFIHNTFKEYLAAGRYVEQRAIKPLEEHVGDPDWENVLLFAAALGRAEFTTDLVGRLVPERPQPRRKERGSISKRQKAALALEYQKRILAVRAVAVAEEIDKAVEKRVQQVQRLLFPPRSMTDAAALAAAGNSILRYLGPHAKQAPIHAARCVRALRLIGTPEAYRILEVYMHSREWRVVAEMADAVGNPLLLPAVVDVITTPWRTPNVYIPRSSIIEDTLARCTDLSPLGSIPVSTSLYLPCVQAKDWSPLNAHPQVRHLSISRATVSNNRILQSVPELESLDISLTEVPSLDYIPNLRNLTYLDAYGLVLRSAESLVEADGLQHLSFAAMAVSELDAIARMPRLETLRLGLNYPFGVRRMRMPQSLKFMCLSFGFDSAPQLEVPSSLTELEIHSTKFPRGIEVGGDPVGVERLIVWAGEDFDLSWTKSMTSLKEVRLHCRGDIDLAALAGLNAIESVVAYSHKAPDLSPLMGLPRLRRMAISPISSAVASAWGKARPEVMITSLRRTASEIGRSD